MTIRKSQNSFLVLTTLGVYLGLLMVGGAAPQVFAHSATTRNFEITDEIEVKDDLDRDPDETHARADLALERYAEALDRFVSDLRESSAQAFSYPGTEQEYVTSTRYPCTEESTKVGFVDVKNFVWEPSLQDAFYKLHTRGLESFRTLAFCQIHHEFPGKTASALNKSVLLSPQELRISLDFSVESESHAKQISRFLHESKDRLIAQPDSETAGTYLRLTKFDYRSNQFFVVTRLPRAGLDALLAKDAK